MAEIIEFGKSYSAAGVANVPEAQENATEEEKSFVQEQMVAAYDLNLEECVVIGTKGGFLHYMNSDISTERILYLLEKYKFFLMREEYEENN